MWLVYNLQQDRNNVTWHIHHPDVKNAFLHAFLQWVIASLHECYLCRTPVDTGSKLGADGDHVCLYMHDLREPHMVALKRILRYVCGTVANAVAENAWVCNLLRELHAPLFTATLVYRALSPSLDLLHGVEVTPRAIAKPLRHHGAPFRTIILMLLSVDFNMDLVGRMLDVHRTPIDTESKLGSDGDPVSDPTLYWSLADADWAGCPTTRRLTSGYCVFLGNNLLSWSSKRQPTLSHFSAEAEYRGVANAVAETCWLCNLLCELHTHLTSAMLVYCDNPVDNVKNKAVIGRLKASNNDLHILPQSG
nr:ribonuclease H-like domain-containing protein [Tanacetum cinerariifolium]